MGLKTSFRIGCSLFFIFLLLLNQVFFIRVIFSSNNTLNINSNICENPVNFVDPFEPNDVGYGLADLFVVDDLVIPVFDSGVDFVDISIPSEPKDLDIDLECGFRSSAFTNFGDTLLFGSESSNYHNYSIMKIDLATNATDCSEIYFLNRTRPLQMILTNDTLYSLAIKFNGYCVFMIYNATNINELTLLDNSTFAVCGYYPSFVVHDNFIYYISLERSLLVYQINSSYQLSFIRGYSFAQLESVYFHENYLFTCNNSGLQIYDYSNPSNLSYITQYDISSAQSIRINNDVAYLTTSDSFTTLDLSDIMDIQLLDQYIPGDMERVDMWKIELSGNLAIVITEILWKFDYHVGYYGGYLYIFDISSPTEIKRLYPGRIPSRNVFDILRIIGITILVIIVVVIILVPTILIWKKENKKKNQKYKE